MMTPLTDQEWLRLLKQDDPQAIEALWLLLHQFAARAVREYSYNEEVTQEGLLHAFHRIKQRGIYQFRFECPFEGYCLTIFTHEMHRARDRLSRHPTDPLPKAVQGEEGIPLHTNPEWLRESIQPCLEGLRAKEREVISRRYGLANGEQTPEEIAADLGITRNHVNVLAHRARLRLKICLEDQGIDQAADLL